MFKNGMTLTQQTAQEMLELEAFHALDRAHKVSLERPNQFTQKLFVAAIDNFQRVASS